MHKAIIQAVKTLILIIQAVKLLLKLQYLTM